MADVNLVVRQPTFLYLDVILFYRSIIVAAAAIRYGIMKT